VPDPGDRFAAFPSRVRGRLQTFLEALDDIAEEDLILFATKPLDVAAHDAAREAADDAAREHHWEKAIAGLRELAFDWLAARISANYRATWFGEGAVLSRRLSTRPLDLQRIAQSLADAFRAVAMWDDLGDGSRDELMGRWAELIVEA